MAIPTKMADLSATASSNSPAGTDTIGSTADDFIRAAYAIMRTTNHKGSDVASATTTDIGAANGEFIDITGTTSITGLGTISAGIRRVCQFDGSLTLTHNATTLILPGGANIQTSAGDVGMFRSLGSGNWICTAWLPASVQPNIMQALGNGTFTAPINLSLAASVATNALTIAIKTDSGSDPSAADPVLIPYRSATASTGTYALRSITAASSITVPSGATLGASNTTAFRIWVVWLDDGTASSIGVINCVDSNFSIYPIADNGIGETATSISTGSDSAQVIYSDGSPTSSFSMRVLGFVNYDSGLTTAGTWDAAPSTIQLFGPDIPLPGAVVQSRYTRDGSGKLGSTAFVGDDTTPQQSTDGNLFLSLAITPRSTANILKITHSGLTTASSSTNTTVWLALFQDSTEDALAVTGAAKDGLDNSLTGSFLSYRMLAGTTSSTTFKMHYGTGTGTVYLNRNAGGGLFNGTVASFIEIEELQG